ncbi:hypothetical protein H4Q26_018274 [Puccinia striiformis f. sp. tritici PST-130]|nr:hypothetical protein H4Q26_018274 [Puccinia striiformis f. sp. tritici PST-130]
MTARTHAPHHIRPIVLPPISYWILLRVCFAFLVLQMMMMAEGMEGIKAGMQASASTTRAGETYERTASLATDAKALAKADSATKKSDQELLFSSSTGGNSGHPYPAHSYSTPYPAHPYYHSPPPFLPVHQPPESSLTRLVNNLKSIYYELRYEFQRLLDFSWMTNLFRPSKFGKFVPR